MATTLRPEAAMHNTPPLRSEDLIPNERWLTAEPELAGEGLTLGRSVLRHPLLVALVGIVGLAVGSAAGYARPVTYTAQAQVMVGRTSGLAEDEVPGLAVAVQQLASDYARLITTAPVVAATEKILGVHTLPGALSASPVPVSSVINVEGQAPTDAGAVALADAGAAALVQDVQKVTSDTQTSLSSLMAAYQAADQMAVQDNTQANLLQSELNALTGRIGAGAPTAGEAQQEQSLSAQIAALQTKANVAQLQAQAYSNQYTAAVPPLQAQDQMAEQMGRASYTGDSRKSSVEIGGFGGLLAGLVVGVGWAVWRSRRTEARREVARSPQL